MVCMAAYEGAGVMGLGRCAAAGRASDTHARRWFPARCRPACMAQKHVQAVAWLCCMRASVLHSTTTASGLATAVATTTPCVPAASLSVHGGGWSVWLLVAVCVCGGAMMLSNCDTLTHRPVQPIHVAAHSA